jgi:hypothetical protein
VYDGFPSLAVFVILGVISGVETLGVFVVVCVLTGVVTVDWLLVPLAQLFASNCLCNSIGSVFTDFCVTGVVVFTGFCVTGVVVFTGFCVTGDVL